MAQIVALYFYSITPHHVFPNPSAARVRDHLSVDTIFKESDLKISHPHAAIQQATPSSRCSVSGESGTNMSFFRRGIHLKYKSSQPNPPDIQSGLLDLSID